MRTSQHIPPLVVKFSWVIPDTRPRASKKRMKLTKLACAIVPVGDNGGSGGNGEGPAPVAGADG